MSWSLLLTNIKWISVAHYLFSAIKCAHIGGIKTTFSPSRRPQQLLANIYYSILYFNRWAPLQRFYREYYQMELFEMTNLNTTTPLLLDMIREESRRRFITGPPIKGSCCCCCIYTYTLGPSSSGGDEGLSWNSKLAAN